MKILIIRMHPSIVNIDTYNLQEIGLAKALVKKGHQCDIVYYNGTKDEKIQEYVFEDKKITIYWLPGKDFCGNIIYCSKLYDIVTNYDVIQSTEYNQIGNIKLYNKFKDKLIIYHGPYDSKINIKENIKVRLFDLYINLFYRKYKNVNIIAKSSLAYEFLKSKGYSNVTTVGVGFDKTRLNSKEEYQLNEQIIEKINNKKMILYIGQIEERRNIDFIINTYKNVYNENKDTILVLVGKGTKEYEEKCKKLITKLELEENIVIIPQLKQCEIGNLYKRANVFLLPSSYEIFGMVLLEAMYYGVPTITTYNGGSATIINNGENGYIIKELDLNEWSTKILDILKNNNQKMSKQAKDTINNKYLWEKLVDKFLELYKKK